MNDLPGHRKLVLMGLRGSGKSTLARELAARSGASSIDLDEWTAAGLGCATVREAWDRHGENGFRAAEVGALRRALASDARIIALGGGTPTAPGAADLLGEARDQNRIALIYLRCTPSELRARLAGDPAAMSNRPSLTGADPLDEIAAVFAARDPVYRALASRTLDGIPDLERAITALRAEFS